MLKTSAEKQVKNTNRQIQKYTCVDKIMKEKVKLSITNIKKCKLK